MNPQPAKERAKGLEPSTSSLGSGESSVQNAANAAENSLVLKSGDARCTHGCTQSDERIDVIARAVAIVAAMPGLTDDERLAVIARLAGTASAP
jgi:hypothetical protein